MILIADILLIAAALGSAFYCRLLSSRLKRLTNTDAGLGGAISTLTYQVNEMKAALAAVDQNAKSQAEDLMALTGRAEKAARQLEILLASLPEEEERSIERLTEPVVPKSVLELSEGDMVSRSRAVKKARRMKSRRITRQSRALHPEGAP